MGIRIIAAAILVLTFSQHCTNAQHCAPIVESYLSSTKLSRTPEGIALTIEYSKTGGRLHPAYQAYLLAYSDRDAEKISQLTPQKAISDGLVTVIDTKLLKRIDSGEYQSVWRIDTEQFVQQMLTAGRISEERVADVGGWKSFEGSLRLAIFIPFLDDQQFSTLDGLPEDRHECNYANDAALLFDPLPQKLNVRFGIVQAQSLEEGRHYIELNGNRP